MQVRDANVWKDSEPWVRDGGVWKPADQGLVRDAGVWKEFYSPNTPFVFSGSWEEDLEGWVGTGTQSNSPIYGSARTGTGFVTTQSEAHLDYIIPGQMARRKQIYASVWSRQVFVATERHLQYRIGEGAWVILHTQPAGTLTFSQHSGSFDHIGDQDVTIRITGSGSIARWDDWEITGTPL